MRELRFNHVVQNKYRQAAMVKKWSLWAVMLVLSTYIPRRGNAARRRQKTLVVFAVKIIKLHATFEVVIAGKNHIKSSRLRKQQARAWWELRCAGLKLLNIVLGPPRDFSAIKRLFDYSAPYLYFLFLISNDFIIGTGFGFRITYDLWTIKNFWKIFVMWKKNDE